MLSTAVETLGFGMLAAAAWLNFGLPAALLVGGVALVAKANLELGRKPRTRKIRIQGPLTNETVDRLAPEAPLTNGNVDRV